MGLKYKNIGHCFFVTTSFEDHQRFGENRDFLDSIAGSIDYCAVKYKAKIAAYCLMPTHIHLLLFIEGEKLSSFMRDFKKYTSQKITKNHGLLIDRLWMQGYDRVPVISKDVFYTKFKYIHNNPVEARLVENADDWPWSSAGDYWGERRGLISIWKDW